MIFGLLLSLSELTYSISDEIAAELSGGANAPPNIGNFALPTPQQPGPFFSFGQNMVDRNTLQISYSGYIDSPLSAGGKGQSGALIYGFTDATSLYFTYPVNSSNASTERLHGKITYFEDPIVQLEHAFYTAGNSNYQDQATIVGFISLPAHDSTEFLSSKLKKTHERSISSKPDFFLGTTFNRTTVDWLGFVSPGIFLATAVDHFKFGTQYLYQAGLGRNIISVSDRFILFALLEFEGQFTEKDTDFRHHLPNTGGNVISLDPSLWFSTKRLILQAGFSIPMVQQLNGNQTKINYSFLGQITWTIA